MIEIFNPQLIIECVIRILLSVIAGFILGLERKSRLQVIGMRTLILISVSSCLLGLLSTFQAGAHDFGSMVDGDPTRISAAVISGVGFLGGGAIVRQGLNIKGLTSAAIIWTAMSIGLSFGAGLYLPPIIVCTVVIISLLWLERLEEKMFPAGRAKTLHLVFEQDDVDLDKVREAIKSCGLLVTDVNLSRVFKTHQIIVRYVVRSPKKIDYKELCDRLNEVCQLGELSLND